ncbi:MAG TPA: PLD nuclease N-terminal domain-containing protein [Streptomyces sp.]|uniref:PLD nuclease N-terminal domain-containing protein n=1 Tax=Streptomyces sp. TaxID=1931 RepID=UPI002D3A6B9E|nr:PLD nuclease N-terminal domain-containing protein [Streptomyces sp.]HZG05824.1 PLD nuclease N-terminal domain-containing protein [Streptomyces sp.]
MLRLLPTVLVLAVWIYAFIDCLNTPENEVRKLPKLAWVFIILFFGSVLLGPIAWFAVGRPRRNVPYGATRPSERRWIAPDDNPEFLRSINERTRRPAPEPPEAVEASGDGGDEGLDRSGDGPRHGQESRNKENGGPEDSAPPAA